MRLLAAIEGPEVSAARYAITARALGTWRILEINSGEFSARFPLADCLTYIEHLEAGTMNLDQLMKETPTKDDRKTVSGKVPPKMHEAIHALCDRRGWSVAQFVASCVVEGMAKVVAAEAEIAKNNGDAAPKKSPVKK